MRRIGWLCAGALLGAFLVSDAAPAAPPPAGGVSGASLGSDPLAAPHVPGEILVRFRPGSGAAGSLAAVGSAAALRLPRTELLHLHDPSQLALELASLRARPDVDFAEPNYRYHALSNDPLFSEQWGLSNAGQRVNGAVGAPGADVRAPQAGAELAGAAPIVVGVLDSGIAASHPDLAGQLVQGHDFVDGDDVPADGLGHGTQVAGIPMPPTTTASGSPGWRRTRASCRCGCSTTRARGRRPRSSKRSPTPAPVASGSSTRASPARAAR